MATKGVLAISKCGLLCHYRKAPEKRQLVECEPIAIMEQTESSWKNLEEEEEDHTVLATLVGESAVFDESFKASMWKFVLHAFGPVAGKKMQIGKFLDKEAAIQYINQCEDKY
jgi:hypothetical protein